MSEQRRGVYGMCSALRGSLCEASGMGTEDVADSDSRKTGEEKFGVFERCGLTDPQQNKSRLATEIRSLYYHSVT
jgi:hypothetical protein